MHTVFSWVMMINTHSVLSWAKLLKATLGQQSGVMEMARQRRPPPSGITGLGHSCTVLQLVLGFMFGFVCMGEEAGGMKNVLCQ